MNQTSEGFKRVIETFENYCSWFEELFENESFEEINDDLKKQAQRNEGLLFLAIMALESIGNGKSPRPSNSHERSLARKTLEKHKVMCSIIKSAMNDQCEHLLVR